jgi:tripartite-type tricarboxylate transporter receptor subunit TctC
MKPRDIFKISFTLFILCISILALTGSAWAAGYPSKPITLVAPYGPGGASDLASRTLAAAVPGYIGQPVVVINKTGAGGVTGSTYVAKRKPDGYTLLLSRIGCNAVAPALNATIPYKWDGFTFLGLLELNPFVYVVKADSPYKTIKDLIEAVKANPGKLSYSTSGPMTLLNMGTQKLFSVAGLDSEAATMVPYKGGGGAKTALLGGHVDFLAINLAPVLDQIQAGKLRALVVTTKERFNAIPDVPTVREAGMPVLEDIIGWSGLWGPPNLPKEVVDKWVTALQGVKKDKAWNKFTKSLGSIPQILPPEETEKFAKRQYEIYHELGKQLGLLIQ